MRSEVREMTDYQAMDLTLFHGTETALDLLVGCQGDMGALQSAANVLAEAQQRCEDMYEEE